ncbi:SCO family protein [Rhodoferax sp.]|uniref:SCO family protein n=1 Tax=Rhodoferax sp. TaxID=50421 RepID=UPI002631718B|nr:SCO family protein [Rhodoferax sp.]MDD2809936.1 SCO family protein [Rhodoferax sp.]MDD4943367.1 SCO family protein [Rhodoferax sp.]MDD5478347.1 SCO family protein [Rhodoferax sp.]
MNKRNALKKIATCALFISATGVFYGCSPNAPKFTAIDITGADYAKDFVLTDHNGQTRSLKDFQGKVVMMFFGYTQCPDVCPTSMAEMTEIKKLLGKDGDRIQCLFVSVDPERDKPDMLKAYMENFDPTFLALYTTPEQTALLAKEYKVYYKKVAGPTPTSYTIDHTAGSYVYDTQGKLRLFTRYGTAPALTVADIKQLLPPL